MIDVLYVSCNRLRYTQETFTALLENTDWDEVRRLYIHDDGSSDGTWQYLLRAANDLPSALEWRVHGTRLGGPVAAMNWYLDQHAATEPDPCERCNRSGSLGVQGDGDQLVPITCPLCDGLGATRVRAWAKIDNDMVVCPGWLNELLRQLTLHPEIDIIGMEPRFGPPTSPPDPERTVEEADFIGGKGLIRHRAFEQCRPRPRSRRAGEPAYFGFSEWQMAHRDIRKAWVTPDLPVFGLDQLPAEPWRKIAAEYEEKGWQRPWPTYDALQPGYWDWWTPRFEAAPVTPA